MDIKDIKFQEGLESEVQSVLDFDLEDKQLVKIIDKKTEEGEPLRQSKVLTKGKVNEDYWLGNQVVKELKDGYTKVIENVIFRNVETIIPILTSTTPEPKLFHPNVDFAEKLIKVFQMRWEVMDEMLEKSRKAIRHNFLRYLGIMKVRKDEETGDIIWENVQTDSMVIDPDATSSFDCEWAAQMIKEYSVREVIEMYPKAKKKLLDKLGFKENDKLSLGTKISFVEFNTPKWTAWKYLDLILDKQKNPNWDWEEETKVDKFGAEQQVAYNVLKKPTIPYIFFQTFNLGKHVYSDTSLVEQARPLQDLINKRKRQIVDNADEAGGTLVGSGEYVSKGEFSKIEGIAGERLWVEKGDARSAVNRLAGNPLQAYVIEDLMETKAELDNIMGTHSTTRGEKSKSPTLGQDVMQKNQDYGRIDDIVKSYEKFCEDYFNMTLQMMIVHYDTPVLYPLERTDDVEISRQILIKELSKVYKYKSDELKGGEYEIEDKFVQPIVMVKRGSTLPIDDMVRSARAVELAKAGKIDDISLFEELKFPNAEQKAARLFLQNNNPQALFPELAEMMGGEQGQQYTPGMQQDTEAIKEGEDPGINQEMQNPETAMAHLGAHRAYMDSDEFKQMDPETKQMYIDHVKAEMEEAKAQSGGGEGAPAIGGGGEAPQLQSAPLPAPMMGGGA